MNVKAFLSIVLAIQVLTFIVLGIVYTVRGDTRVGVAQLLLAAVQAIVYSAGIH